MEKKTKAEMEAEALAELQKYRGSIITGKARGHGPMVIGYQSGVLIHGTC